MKCQIPEISWHNRDPVLSIDFQPRNEEAQDDFIRLASGGSDSHVLIWYLTVDEGVIKLDLAADLTRHQKAVNCVRWSPNGQLLASCDDECFIIVWRKKPDQEALNICDDVSDGDKEIWLTYKTLRGHIEDIYDLAFSPDSQFLVSGSVDNTAMIWDIEKSKSSAIVREHKGFVQGVAWDPQNKYFATLSTDRHLRIFDVKTKKNIQRISKSSLPVSPDSPLYNKQIKLFHDDMLQTFFRRLSFSPEGSLIVAPSGFAELEGSKEKPFNTTYIYTRCNLKEPAIVLPSPDQYTIAVRFCPLLFELRESKAKPVISLPYRMIFAIATKCSVYLYDTQQKLPFALISNIHYTRLTDLSWSNDGRFLVVSSTDGFCSIIYFAKDELGKVYGEKSAQDVVSEKMAKEDANKKKKKTKRPNVTKKNASVDNLDKSNVTEEKDLNEKENDANNKEAEEMDVDDDSIAEVPLDNIPEKLKEIIPVDKIIKSTECFSPEKQPGSPATPIQVRKCPRAPEEISTETGDKKLTPGKSESESTADVTTTPKGVKQSKTPNRLTPRHFPRTFSQPSQASTVNATVVNATEKVTSPMERALHHSTEKIPPSPNQQPRRVEFRTLTTPKSKKRLL